MTTEMLESKLRNAARRAAVKFLVCNINTADANEVSYAVHDFETALATADDKAVGGDLRLNDKHEVYFRFDDCSVQDLYDMYHGLVEDFVKEALSDF